MIICRLLAWQPENKVIPGDAENVIARMFSDKHNVK